MHSVAAQGSIVSVTVSLQHTDDTLTCSYFFSADTFHLSLHPVRNSSIQLRIWCFSSSSHLKTKQYPVSLNVTYEHQPEGLMVQVLLWASEHQVGLLVLHTPSATKIEISVAKAFYYFKRKVLGLGLRPRKLLACSVWGVHIHRNNCYQR